MFDAPLAAYEAHAAAVLTALGSGDDAAAWRFKWSHPRFRGRHVREVRSATLTADDARLLIAQEQAFDTWADLERFIADVASGGDVQAFERTVEVVVGGDLAALSHTLARRPELVHARSARRHHCTLLHYLGANGVEPDRQRTPPNALEVARALLDAGAAPDALADLYDQRCTTLSMVVSSSHPAAAGLQLDLALLLLDRGARLVGPGSKWQSAVLTALMFGYLDTARGLAARAGAIEDVVELAGLGRLDDVRAGIGAATPGQRQAALSLAAQLGHAEVVGALLAYGADPNRYNPDGFHAHATPLHQAVWHGHRGVVEQLVESGARLDLRDTIYDGTPLDWAVHGKQDELAAYLRSRG
jgi:ankyrin repeat protein